MADAHTPINYLRSKADQFPLARLRNIRWTEDLIPVNEQTNTTSGSGDTATTPYVEADEARRAADIGDFFNTPPVPGGNDGAADCPTDGEPSPTADAG